MDETKLEPNYGCEQKCEDLTICIPMWDSAMTISATLTMLNGYQEVENLKVIIADNGSKDGSAELVQTVIKNNWFPRLQIRFIQAGKPSNDRWESIYYMRQLLVKSVDTDYMMFVDGDIILSPNTLKPTLRYLKDHPKIGGLNVRFAPGKDHVPTASTMYKTDVIKKCEWKPGKFICDCLDILTQLNLLGYSSEYMPEIQCRHFKSF